MAINSFQPRIMRRIMTHTGIEPEPETNDLLASRNIASASFLMNSFNSFLASCEKIIISFSKLYECEKRKNSNKLPEKRRKVIPRDYKC